MVLFFILGGGSRSDSADTYSTCVNIHVF